MWIGKGKLFNILRDEATTARIQLVVEAKVVKALDECRVGDCSREPQEVYVGGFVSNKPITIAVDDGAI